jgi:hypothetical protein
MGCKDRFEGIQTSDFMRDDGVKGLMIGCLQLGFDGISNPAGI